MDDTQKHSSSIWTENQSATQSNEGTRAVDLSACERLQPSIDRSGIDAKPVAVAIQGLSPSMWVVVRLQCSWLRQSLTVETISSSPLDFCKPVVRDYPRNGPDLDHPTQGLAIQHISVITKWGFSQYAEAQELYRIHQTFTVMLERLLASEIWEIYRRDHSQNTGEDESCLTAGVVRGISFCRGQLVGDMADSLYTTQEDMRVRAQLGLLRLYLAASDCLVRYDGSETRDTSITVQVHHDGKSQTPSPLVQAAWVPDSIVFKDLDRAQCPCEGQEFTIIPHYQCNSAFASTHLPANVRYSIESQFIPLTWLTWDERIAGFKGIMPMYSATLRCDCHHNVLVPMNSLCIDVTAVIVEGNGSCVQFERIVRARLTLKVLSKADCFYDTPHQRTGSGATLYSLDFQGLAGPAAGLGIYGSHSHAWSPNHDNHLHVFDSEHGKHPFLSIAKLDVKPDQLPNLAEKHAHLAAKHADLAQRHANAERHARLIGSLGRFGMPQIQPQQSGFQVYCAANLERTPVLNGRGKAQRAASDRSASSDVSEYALDDITISRRTTPYQEIPRSPGLDERTAVQNQVVGSSHDARFSVLPPSAVRLIPSQTFDDTTQAWTPIQPPPVTPLHHACRSGSHIIQAVCGQQCWPWPPLNEIRNVTRYRQRSPMTRLPQRRSRSPSVSEDCNVSSNHLKSPMDGGIDDLGLANVIKILTSSRKGENDRGTPVVSGKGSLNRHAGSSLDDASPSKRAKEDENNSRTPTSSSDMASCNYSPPLHNEKHSVLGANRMKKASFWEGWGEDTDHPTREGPSSSHWRTDSGCHSDLQNPLRSSAEPSQFLRGVPTPFNTLSNVSPAAQNPKNVRSSTETICSNQIHNLGQRTNSVHSWQSDNPSSRAASSNIEVIVETSQEAKNRRGQASFWHQLSGSEYSDKEKQPEIAEAEPRLSDDERKAIEEAIKRSLNDLTEDFSGIFFDDSDDLAFGDELSAADNA